MLSNVYYIGFILAAFSQAKIIHVKRDAMAICWSIFKSDFPIVSNELHFDLEDIGHSYLRYAAAMEVWNSLFPTQIYELNYENFTANFEEEARKLLNYCDLEWEDNVLDFHKNKRDVGTASRYQVQRPLYQGSSEAWKRYERYLVPLKEALDIDL